MKIDIVVTKQGLPALWEKGGGYRNTGEATIVTDSKGGRKRPIYIRQKGELANREHALFVVHPGDLVIQARHHRGDYEIDVMRIVRIDVDEKTAELEQLYCFRGGQWDKLLSDGVWQAVMSAMSKANCYHCRWPHYALAPEPAHL